MTDHLVLARQRLQALADSGASTQAALAEVLAEALEAKAAATSMMRTADDWKADHADLLKCKKPASVAALAAVAGDTRAALDLLVSGLEQHKGRILKMEARRSMSFAGAYTAGKTYARGDAVQKAGGLFVCLADTADAPGASSAWRQIGVSR